MKRIFATIALLIGWALPASAQGFAVESAAIPSLSAGCVFQVQSLGPTVIICGAAGSGTVDGSGTADTIAMWTASGVIGNSGITKSGTVYTAATWNAQTALTIAGASINTVGTLGNVCYNSQACTITGGNITGVLEANITVGSLLARLSSANVFTANQQINGTNKNFGLGNITIPTTNSDVRHAFIGITAIDGQDAAGESGVGSNNYYNSGPKFMVNGWANRMRMYLGQFEWQTSSASGTAGNAITWNTFMSLSNAGAFSVGTPVSGMAAGDASFSRSSTVGIVSLGSDGLSYLFRNGSDNVSIYSNGNRYLQMNGGIFDIQYANLKNAPTYALTSGSAANVFIDSDGVFYRSSSSLRYKSDVQPFNGGLADVLKMQPVSFLGNNDLNGPRHLGFTAEALDAAGFYNVVMYDAQGRPDAVQYDRLTTYLVNAIKELASEVDALRGKPTQRTASTPDKASKAKALAKEADAAKSRDAKRNKETADTATREARQAVRAIIDACMAENAVIIAQGGRSVECAKSYDEKREAAAMATEWKQAEADRANEAKKALASCETRNQKIIKQGGKPLVCGGVQ